MLYFYTATFIDRCYLLQVKSLSQPVIDHVRQIFNDEHHENKYYATIPAIIKRGNNIEVVQRVWLGQYEKMKTKYKRNGM